MAASPKKQLALDANLLLDLAEEKDFAHEFREEFQGRGYGLLVPPTVLAELDVLATYGAEPQRRFADTALENPFAGNACLSRCLPPSLPSRNDSPRGCWPCA